MSGEKEPIRANRLSNREVMLSSAALRNINMPSTSTSGDYINSNRISSVSSELTDKSSGKRRFGTNTSTSTSASANASVNASQTTNGDSISGSMSSSSSIPQSNADHKCDANTDDDLSLSQYELDIMNKYLNELCDSDESNEHDETISENLDEQLAIARSSISIDSGDSSLNQSPSDLVNVNVPQSNEIESESPSLSLSQSQSQSQCEPKSQSQSQFEKTESQSLDASSLSSSPPSPSLSASAQQPIQVSNLNANAIQNQNPNPNDAIRCTQTSRQLEFDQPFQSNAMLNQNRNTQMDNTHIDTHHDVNNNNNLSLNSNIMGQQSSSNNISGQSRLTSGRRYCNNNRRTNTNTPSDSNRITANLPIVVGITSCIWGLFFYAAKSFYSDFT